MKRVVTRLALATVTAALSVGASAHEHQHEPPDRVDESSPLVQKVRAATEQFKDINVALNNGWVRVTPFVSVPDFGAMGVHLVNNENINSTSLDPTKPEALIYEPLPNGAYRLVGVEFIILKKLWDPQSPDGTPPALAGQLRS